jgi:molecular chaperone DnaK (HSP70)
VGGPRSRQVGLDFETTNSSLAVCDADGKVTVAVFPSLLGPTESFRSILYFPRKGSTQRSAGSVHASPSAHHEFTSTIISGRPYTFGELVSSIVKRFVTEAEQQWSLWETA